MVDQEEIKKEEKPSEDCQPPSDTNFHIHQTPHDEKTDTINKGPENKEKPSDSFWGDEPLRNKIRFIIEMVLSLFAACTLVATFIVTSATKEQLGITRDQLHTQSRAWLCAAGIYATDGFKVGDSPTVIIKFSSTGNSPARDMTIKYNMNLRNKPLPDNMPMGEYLSKEPSRGVIAPNSEFSSPKYTKKEIVFTEEDIGEISRNERKLYVYGFIDYLDIFNVRHCTNFCFVSRVEGPENKVGFQVCSNNNEMADKECKDN